MTTQITKAQFLSERTEEIFFQGYAELLAHFNINELKESLSSFMQLNYSADRLRVAPTEPGSYRRILAFSTITLLNRDAVLPLTTFNEAANADMDRLRRETDIDVELIKNEPAPPTAEELLADEVRRDWKTLSSAQIRKKKNASRQYSAMLEKLANTPGGLDSQITCLRIAGS